MSVDYSQKIRWEKDKRLIHSKGFLAYCQYHCKTQSQTISVHQRLMINVLEEAMTTPKARLIIKMPPRHGKSTFSSILAPSYYLGRFPGKNIIMTTHTQEFSDRWGRKCRSIIQDPFYQYVFKTSLSKTSSAAARFDLLNNSSYFASGILGNITGLGADLLIGDDWYRGREDADSEVIRQKIWEAYIWDLRTRLAPGGSVVLIGTPWHEDDHFERIIQSNDGHRWTVVELPALIETQEQKDTDILKRDIGHALWPAQYSADDLIEIRDSLNQEDLRMWNSLYQVKPTLNTGDYFLSEWIQRVNHVPSHLDYYGTSDYAVSHGKGDYTVHIVFGYDPKHNEIYIVDVWRKRTTTDVWIEQFIDLALEYNTLIWADEGGIIEKSLNSYIQKAMNDRKVSIYRKAFTSTSDKSARAQNFRALMAQKKVFIKNAPWTDDLIKEMLAFPSGKHDDQVDALGLIGRLLRELFKTVEKSQKKEEYEYKSGTIILPGLDFKMNRRHAGLRTKI